MDVELAEQPPEREVLLGRDLLVAEEDDQVLDQRAVNLFQLLGRERPRQIDADELGADQWSELLDRERAIRRGLGWVRSRRGPFLKASSPYGQFSSLHRSRRQEAHSIAGAGAAGASLALRFKPRHADTDALGEHPG